MHDWRNGSRVGFRNQSLLVQVRVLYRAPLMKKSKKTPRNPLTIPAKGRKGGPMKPKKDKRKTNKEKDLFDIGE